MNNFFILFDVDYDDTEFTEYGEILDLELGEDDVLTSVLEGLIDFRNVTLTNYYLRNDDIDYSFVIYLDSQMPTLEYQ